jgi:hypothetical protein
MASIKRYLVALLLVTATIPAIGSVYQGTITQSVVATNDTGYTLGQTFVGSYRYQASAVDGTFHVNDLIFCDANLSLTGSIFLTFPDGIGGFTGLENTPHTGYLTVLNGSVTDFGWSWEVGNYYAGYFEGSLYSIVYGRYNSQTGEALEDISTRSTLMFSRPTLVPESASTGLLALAALTTLGVWNRRR